MGGGGLITYDAEGKKVVMLSTVQTESVMDGAKMVTDRGLRMCVDCAFRPCAALLLTSKLSGTFTRSLQCLLRQI